MRAVAFALVAVVLLTTWFGSVHAQEDGSEGPGYDAAVLPFRVAGDLSGSALPESLGEIMRERVEVSLVQEPTFRVVSRGRELDRLLEERALSADGLTSTDEAADLAGGIGADVLVTGTIYVLSEDSLTVTANFIDVETSRLRAKVEDTVSSIDELSEVAQRFIEDVLDAFPLRLEGQIVYVQDDGLAFIDIGSRAGLTDDYGGGVIEAERNVAGVGFRERIGSFSIVQVDTERTLIRVDMDGGREAEVGQFVRVDGDPGDTDGTPTPPTPQGPTGVLSVTSDPLGVVLAVDGVELGSVDQEDAAFTLPAGDVAVRASLPGFVAETYDVGIRPNSVTSLNVRLERARGAVRFDVEPEGATVFLDGVERGDAPLTVTGLAVGRHEYEISASGYRTYVGVIEVEAGRTASVRVGLEARPGTLDLELEPADARATLDGNPVSAGVTRLQPGTYRLSAERNGYATDRRVVEISAGLETEVTVSLDPLPGTITIAGVPPGTTVRVDGGEPQDAAGPITVAAGVRTLVLDAAGFQRVERQVEVPPGEDVVERIVLDEARGRLDVRVVAASAERYFDPEQLDVTLDGEPIDVWPDRVVEVAVGASILRAMAPGYESIERTVEVREGDLTSVRLRLELLPARVIVDADVQDVELVANGTSRGTGRAFTIEPGAMRIELIAPEREPIVYDVELQPGEVTTLEPEFERVAGVLDLAIAPADARASLDGRSIEAGTTPVPPGRYELRVERQGYERALRTVEIEPGDTTTVSVELEAEPGRIVIEGAPPDATVRVDGGPAQDAGSAIAVSPGGRTILVDAPGYVATERLLDVPPGGEVVETVVLEEAQGTLDISVNVGSARQFFDVELLRVTVDGEAVGGSGVSRTTELATGPHVVRAAAPGFEETEASVMIALGERTSVTLSIEPLPARLVLDTDVRDVSVIVDGVSLGRGSEFAVRPGRISVELRAPARVPVTYELDLGPDERRTLRPEFEIAPNVRVEAGTGTLVFARGEDGRLRRLGEVSGDVSSYALPPGSYDITLAPPDVAPRYVTIDVPPDGSVVVRLPATVQVTGPRQFQARLEGPDDRSITIRGGTSQELEAGTYDVFVGGAPVDEVRLVPGEVFVLNAESYGATPSNDVQGTDLASLTVATNVGGASVELIGPDARSIEMDGVSETLIVQPGTYTVVVSRPPFGTNDDFLLLGAGERARLDLELEAPEVSLGRIYRDGEPAYVLVSSDPELLDEAEASLGVGGDTDDVTASAVASLPSTVLLVDSNADALATADLVTRLPGSGEGLLLPVTSRAAEAEAVADAWRGPDVAARGASDDLIVEYALVPDAASYFVAVEVEAGEVRSRSVTADRSGVGSRVFGAVRPSTPRRIVVCVTALNWDVTGRSRWLPDTMVAAQSCRAYDSADLWSSEGDEHDDDDDGGGGSTSPDPPAPPPPPPPPPPA